MKLTVERLRELLRYDPTTGVFAWVADRGGAKAGTEAGAINAKGYRYICIDYTLYAAHRLAWMFVHGDCVPSIVDHKDGNPLNNRIENLRAATRSQNGQNRSAVGNNQSGHVGVYFIKGMKRPWQARLRVDGQQIYLGNFLTPEDAAAARREAAIQHHGEFVRSSS